MDFRSEFKQLLESSTSVLALAPMQDVTDLAFWRLIASFGGPDVYFTEYFRVHSVSRLDKPILQAISENPGQKPVVAQLIGNDIGALVRSARELQEHPVAAIDLNLGCPAPVVYRKCAGGGLLRYPEMIDSIVGHLREAITIKFTVKTRVGFESPDGFGRLLQILRKHSPDLVTVHARTVKDMYGGVVRYDLVKQAVETLNCPVLANGNVFDAETAHSVLKETGAHGLMLGRGAIRNPWIFEQIRQFLRGENPRLPTGREVLEYIHRLFSTVTSPLSPEEAQVQRVKKYTRYLAHGIDAEGEFFHQIQRVTTRASFMQVCQAFLDHNDPMRLSFDQAVSAGKA